jgi:hypothetical protein
MQKARQRDQHHKKMLLKHEEIMTKTEMQREKAMIVTKQQHEKKMMTLQIELQALTQRSRNRQ